MEQKVLASSYGQLIASATTHCTGRGLKMFRTWWRLARSLRQVLLSCQLVLGSTAIAGAQSGGVTVSSSTAAASPSVPPSEVQVLEKLVNRDGPVATIGIINRAVNDAKLAGTALICVAKGLPSNANTGEESGGPWLFAAPLWHGTTDSTIQPGAN